MAITYEPVAGAEFAARASAILEEAWNPPALSYTPAYLRWQLSFPGPAPLPSVAAFEGGDALGFAGASWRRMRHGARYVDVAAVSFVAVRPAWRNRGIASGLYRCLLGGLRRNNIPVLTYALQGSAGQAVLLRAYEEAGFVRHDLGSYAAYKGMWRDTGVMWPDIADVPAAEADAQLAGVMEPCALDGDMLWSHPSPEQTRHYFEDPRPRRLVRLPDREGNWMGLAWLIESEVRSAQGTSGLVTVDCVSLPRDVPGPLAPLLRNAARWKAASPVVSFPSLMGFDRDELRHAGLRQTGSVFDGYLFTGERWKETPRGTSLEIV